MNVAQPIIDFWRNLARREQVLAGIGVLVILVVLVFLLLMGGEEPPPIDASTSAAEQPITERAVEPAPGTIVANKVPTQPVATPSAATGVAPISSSSSEGGGDATAEDISEGVRLEKMQTWVDVEKVVDFPPFSEAVAAAGRDLERVAAEYQACVAVKTDIRPCVNVVKYGVYIKNNLHADGKGVTFNKQSSDGTSVAFTIMPGGVECRAVEDQPSCTAWKTS